MITSQKTELRTFKKIMDKKTLLSNLTFATLTFRLNFLKTANQAPYRVGTASISTNLIPRTKPPKRRAENDSMLCERLSFIRAVMQFKLTCREIPSNQSYSSATVVLQTPPLMDSKTNVSGVSPLVYALTLTYSNLPFF